MTEQDVRDLLLEIRFFVTDQSDACDPYRMKTEVIDYIDERLKEI